MLRSCFALSAVLLLGLFPGSAESTTNQECGDVECHDHDGDHETSVLIQIRAKDSITPLPTGTVGVPTLAASTPSPTVSVGMPTVADFDAAMEAFLALPQEELTWTNFYFDCDEKLNMDFKVVELATPFIGGSYMTRGFEEVPGLVLRVKPGGSLKFRLNNKLEAGPGESGCNGTVGLFSSPTMTCKSNSTNIHTHGLHSSPEGNEDNVFLSIAPGESRDYDIKVPGFHMGGTHWYHSHLHHSTALQAGGGAHGLIVVEDPKGSLPKMVQDNGMMLYWNITGEEGTQYPAQEKLDPTCYEGAFPDEHYWGN